MDARSVIIATSAVTGESLLVLGGTVWLLRRFKGAGGGADGRAAPRGHDHIPWHPPPAEQVYRVIVVVDIERFGRAGWDDEIRVRSVRAVRGALAETFSGAGIPPENWNAISTGDGLLVFASPEVGTANVLRALLDRLAAGLATRNRLLVTDAWLRLRVVLHAGHVMVDHQTVLGEQVNLAFRLLDADSLKSRLRHSHQPAVVAVSQHIYEQVVQQRALGLDPDHFEPLLVNVKETSVPAWVYTPDGLLADGQDLSVPTTWLREQAS
jgi:class 3 adenylate cyclase